MSASVKYGRKRPWYREVWPWLLMLPPAASVVGGVTMIYLANNTTSALVVEDYSRIEEITSTRFERDRRAAELNLTAELTFATAPAHVEAVLAAPESFVQPRVLLLGLRHATNPEADRELTLVRAGVGYTVAAELLPGHYRAELSPDDRSWRLGGELYRLDGRIVLAPQTE